MKQSFKNFFKYKTQFLIVPAFLIAVFIFRFPTLNLLGPLRSHMIAKIIVLMLSFYVLLRPNNTLQKMLRSPLHLFLLLYLFIRSLGILNAVNIEAFMVGYQRFLFGFFCFYLGVYCVEKRPFSSLFALIMIITSVVNTSIDLCLYFVTDPTLSILRLIVSQDLFHFIQANVERGRTPFSMFSESSASFLLLMWYAKERSWTVKKMSSILISLTLIITAFLSSWRIRVVEFVFSAFCSWLMLLRKSRQRVSFLLFVGVTILSVGFVINLVTYSKSSSLVDRTFANSFDKDATRPKLWRRAWDIGLSFPLTGVGFDNFIYFFSDQTESLFSSTLFQNKKLLMNLVHQSPHNIVFTHIAESGLLGGIVFVCMLFLFLRNDLTVLKQKDESDYFLFAVIIQFWTLVIFGMFHPTDSTEFYCLFFVSRGIIQGLMNRHQNPSNMRR